jgi:hypothetical protein
MADPTGTPRPADTDDPARVDRGQRVWREASIEDGHDGAAQARFVRAKSGELPADSHGRDGTRPAPVTTEDVVESPDTASAWEAIEREGH